MKNWISVDFNKSFNVVTMLCFIQRIDNKGENNLQNTYLMIHIITNLYLLL